MTKQKKNFRELNRRKRDKWDRREKHPKTGRLRVLLVVVAGALLFTVTASFAWYTITNRIVKSKETAVMKPYYLTLLNPGETASLNLTVGSLYPGETKNILFCVSNKDNTGITMGGSDFNYSMQLVHTDNLAVEYHLYELEKVPEVKPGETGIYIAEDPDPEEPEKTITTYWKKKILNDIIAPELSAADVTTAQRTAAGLADTQMDAINAGTYLKYTKDVADNDLKLVSSTTVSGYDSHFFLMEINWNSAEMSNFEKYEKETDMIYLLVQALQPEPVKKT